MPDLTGRSPSPLGSEDSGPVGPVCGHDDPDDQEWGLHESCAEIRLADDSVPFTDDLRFGAPSWDGSGVRAFVPLTTPARTASPDTT